MKIRTNVIKKKKATTVVWFKLKQKIIPNHLLLLSQESNKVKNKILV